MGPPHRSLAALFRQRAIWAYAVAAVVAAVLGVLALRLWRADLRVPFHYQGDVLAFALWVKSVIDNGWYLTTPQVGAPGVLTMHDFPIAETFHMSIFKLMSAVSGDWALLFNLYFLLGFPLITMSAFAVFRHFGVRNGPALAGSLLFAFLPSRLIKGELHYFLDIFYQVPLAILVLLWVCGDEPPLIGAPGSSRWFVLEFRRGRTRAAVIICALTSATGVYYAFFTGVLLLLGGAWASLERRTARNVLAGGLLSGVIFAGLALQSLPIVAYERKNGPNPEVSTREHVESEIYALRIAQLLLPVAGHRVPALQRLKDHYDRSAPFRGESSSTSLGLVGSVGFLGLLMLVLLRARRDPVGSEVLRRLAVLNFLAVLVATTGGFGSLFALLVTPQIRGYSRMHVFIAFFSLFAVVLVVDEMARRRRLLAWILPPALVLLGFYDQVTPLAVRPYQRLKSEYQRDAAFVQRIEGTVPAGAMIFELPYMPFPEGAQQPGQRRADYDLLRPSFHSRTLRWSYPTMLGRWDDAWVEDTAAQPPGKLIARLVDAGFAGIFVDRLVYADDGRAIEAVLAKELGAAPIATPDRSLLFFDLSAYERRVDAGLTAAEREHRRDLALHPVLVRWLAGCYRPENKAEGPFRWCGEDAALEIGNDAQVAQSTVVHFKAFAAVSTATLSIESDLVSQALRLDGAGTSFTRTLSVPPGHHRIQFRCDGAPERPFADARKLVWRVEGFMLDEAPPALNP
jgi:phosphoglycerol transferase